MKKKNTICKLNYLAMALMIFTNTMPAYATEYKEATQETENADVYLLKESTYTITIPKTIILDSETDSGQYTVSVTGNLSGTEVIRVVPDEIFMMSQNGKDDIPATVSQNKTRWKHNEINDTAKGTIIVSNVSAGEWNGSFNFEIIRQDLKTLEVGMYDAKGNALFTWAESGIDETCSNAQNIIANSETKITSIVIPDTVTIIGNDAFWGCSTLTDVIIPDSVYYVGEHSFEYCTGLTDVTLNVEVIGPSAFYGCSNLKNVVLKDGLTSIGTDAFKGCENLTKITVPNTITNIGDGAFSGCKNLTSISLSEGLENIGGEAFQNCESLTTLTIPSSIKKIGMFAFENCKNLTSITWNGKTYTDKTEFNTALSNANVCNYGAWF